MPDSMLLTAGLTSPGVQIADETDLRIVATRCYTERWSIDKKKVKIGTTIQIAANNRDSKQPRGYAINSVITDVVLLKPRPDEKRKRYRIHFDHAAIIDTGRRDITFTQYPVRYF